MVGHRTVLPSNPTKAVPTPAHVKTMRPLLNHSAGTPPSTINQDTTHTRRLKLHTAVLYPLVQSHHTPVPLSHTVFQNHTLLLNMPNPSMVNHPMVHPLLFNLNLSSNPVWLLHHIIHPDLMNLRGTLAFRFRLRLNNLLHRQFHLRVLLPNRLEGMVVYPDNPSLMCKLSMYLNNLSIKQACQCNHSLRLNPRFNPNRNQSNPNNFNLLLHKHILRPNLKSNHKLNLNRRRLHLCNSSNRMVLRSSTILMVHTKTPTSKPGLSTTLTGVLIPLDRFTSSRFPESRKHPNLLLLVRPRRIPLLPYNHRPRNLPKATQIPLLLVQLHL